MTQRALTSVLCHEALHNLCRRHGRPGNPFLAEDTEHMAMALLGDPQLVHETRLFVGSLCWLMLRMWCFVWIFSWITYDWSIEFEWFWIRVFRFWLEDDLMRKRIMTLTGAPWSQAQRNPASLKPGYQCESGCIENSESSALTISQGMSVNRMPSFPDSAALQLAMNLFFVTFEVCLLQQSCYKNGYGWRSTKPNKCFLHAGCTLFFSLSPPTACLEPLDGRALHVVANSYAQDPNGHLEKHAGSKFWYQKNTGTNTVQMFKVLFS